MGGTVRHLGHDVSDAWSGRKKKRRGSAGVGLHQVLDLPAHKKSSHVLIASG
jgi:hypothetical protein